MGNYIISIDCMSKQNAFAHVISFARVICSISRKAYSVTVAIRLSLKICSVKMDYLKCKEKLLP